MRHRRRLANPRGALISHNHLGGVFLFETRTDGAKREGNDAADERSASEHDEVSGFVETEAN